MNSFFFLFTILILIFNLHVSITNTNIITTITEDNDYFIARLNHGALFRVHSILDNSNSFWRHIYRLRLPQIPEKPPIMSNPCTHTSTTITLSAFTNFNLCDLYDELIDSYNKQSAILYDDIIRNMNAIYSYMHVPQDTTRTKRGLFNFVGDAYKFLFGLSTTSDYERLLTVIHQLNQQSNSFATVTNAIKDELLSHVKLQERQSKFTLEKITINYNNTKVLANEVLELTKAYNNMSIDFRNFEYLLSHFIRTLIVLQNQRITSLQFIQSDSIELLSAFEVLAENRISPRLVSPQKLEKLFKQISRILDKEYPQFFISNPKVHSVYDGSTVLHFIDDQFVYIQISVPLTSYDSTFRIYEIYKLMNPISHNVSNVYTQLKNLPEFFAISLNKEFYMELSLDELNACPGLDIRHCSQNLPIQKISKQSCAISLFLNNIGDINKYCPSNTIFSNSKTLQDTIIPLGGSSYYISLPHYDFNMKWTLTCPSTTKIIDPCNWCLIKIPCQCSLVTPISDIAPSMQSCSNVTSHSDLEITYPINLPFLTAFLYNQTILGKFESNSMLSSIPQIEIPHTLQLIVQPNITDEEELIKIDTKKLVERLKQQNVIHLNPIDDALARIQDTYALFPPWIHWIHFFFHALLILTIIALVMLTLKIRSLAGLLLLSAVTSPMRTTTAFIIQSPMQPQQISINYLELPTIPLYIGAVILSLLVFTTFILFCKQLYARCAFYISPMKYFVTKRTETKILLELISQSSFVVLEVAVLPGHWSHINIENANITIHSFLGGCTNKFLRVDWHNTKVTVAQRLHNIILPQLIPVPWTVTNLTQQITTAPNLKLFLLFGNAGHYQIYSRDTAPDNHPELNNIAQNN
jgi:hypothetical protein